MSHVMTIAAIRNAFPDQWVVVEVTRVDKADVPLAGVVLTRSPEKLQAYQAVQAHRAHHPTARVFVFFTGDPIPEGVAIAFALR